MAVLTATVTDLVNPADTTAAVTVGTVGTDSAGLTDSVTAVSTTGPTLRTVSDATGVTDTPAALTITVSGSDRVALTDTVTVATVTKTATLTDPAGIDDGGTRQSVLEAVTDRAGFTDTVTADFSGPPPDPPSGGTIDVLFPRLVVQIANGGVTPQDPAADGFVLGRGRLGVSTLGALVWVDVAADVISISINAGASQQAEAASPATVTLTVDNTDGPYDPAVTGCPYDIGQHVRVRAEWAGVLSDLFYGYVDEIVPDYGYAPTVTFSCSDGLALLGRAKVREVPAAFAGDSTGLRVGRVLDEAHWPATLRTLDTGIAVCAADTYGDFALPLIQRVVDSEFGELHIDGAGRVVFSDRLRVYLAARSVNVQATFSDTGSDIDMEGLTGALRRGDLYNQATVTRAADGAVEQFYEDPASVARYGPITFSGQAGAMLNDDAAAQSLARFIVARFKTPSVRFTDIAVDATVQGMWAQLLPLRRFDRIRAVRNYGPHAIDVQILIEGISHAVTSSPPTWKMTFATRNTDDNFTPFRLGISKLGTGTLA